MNDTTRDRSSSHSHASESPAPLSVSTDLVLTIDDTEATLSSTGERVFVEFDSVADALRAFRASGASTDRANRLTALLRTTDLTVEVRVHGRTVAVAGVGARPGFVSRRLGVAPTEVRLGGGLGALGRELTREVAKLERALR